MTRLICSITFLLCIAQHTMVQADRPIVTDEFDTFLVTDNTAIGDVIGGIELVEPNALSTTWSLEKPVPGGDRRNYLKDGQLYATDIVAIDPESGEIRLIARPADVPGHYYAEVRASNDDGYMEQVLIIVALNETPLAGNALNIFTQRKQGGGIGFYATASVDPGKVDYAAKVASALLSKDRRGTGKISENVKKQKAVMTLFYTFEERNTSISFYMFADTLDIRTQDLEDEEIIPDYLRMGGPDGLRRDASVEEITHLIHRGGIMDAYPGVQERLVQASGEAVKRGFFEGQPGLPLEDYPDEYLVYGLDIYYGVHSNRQFEGVALTPENLKIVDPELYDIVSFLFPDKDEFFTEMGW